MESYTISVPRSGTKSEQEDFEMAIRWREYVQFYTEIRRVFFDKNIGKIDDKRFIEDLESIIMDSNLPSLF